MNSKGTLWERRSFRYVVCVAIPTLVVWIYLATWSSPGFISRSQLLVEQDASPALSGAELALGLLSVGGGKSKQDALLVRNYMLSRSMLTALDSALNLRAHYSDRAVDWWARLPADAPFEDFYEHYLNHVQVTVEDESLALHLEVEAFAPEFAEKLSTALVERSEQFVNHVSRQLAQEQLGFMQGQVDEANERLKAASIAMIQLQRDNEVFSPEKEGETLGEILLGLEVELAKQKTQLTALTAYLQDSAPDVIAAKRQVDALEAQIAQERGRLVGAGQSGLNDLMLTYQDAEVNLRLAGELYKSALATMESTRLDSVRKVKYLVSVDAPSRPDAPELPRVLYWTTTVFLLLNLVYFVANLVAATIQDHRE